MRTDPARPLAIIGNLNVDQWLGPVTRFPAWDEELLIETSRVELAGSAGYIALACRALGIAPFIVSTVGDDLFGHFTLDTLRALGLETTGVEIIPGLPTPLGLIFVGPDGERGILSVLGAHAEMSAGLALRHDERVAACPEVFLCGNYLLPRCAPLQMSSYARMARARGQTVVFDPSWDPGGWSDHVREETRLLLPDVDVYLPNQEELCRLTATSSWERGLDAIRGLAAETVIKRGAAGAVYASATEVIEVSGLPIEAVNTIGAGDVFDAAYLYGRRRGWQPTERLSFACAYAAHVVAQRGERHYPDEQEVGAFRDRLSQVSSGANG